MVNNKLNITTLNVNGIRQTDKLNRVFEWLKLHKVDIGFLQETHFDESIENRLKIILIMR